MSHTNPSESSEATDECHDCLHRVEAGGSPGPCPECGSPMRNVAVPRE